MVRWHHWFHGYDFEQTQEDSEREGSLGFYIFCISVQQLNWTDTYIFSFSELLNSFCVFLKLSFFIRLLFTSTSLSTWKIIIIAALISFFFFACQFHYLFISRFNWLIFLKAIGCLFFFFNFFMTCHFEWVANNHSFYSFGFWIL